MEHDLLATRYFLLASEFKQRHIPASSFLSIALPAYTPGTRERRRAARASSGRGSREEWLVLSCPAAGSRGRCTGTPVRRCIERESAQGWRCSWRLPTLFWRRRRYLVKPIGSTAPPITQVPSDLKASDVRMCMRDLDCYMFRAKTTGSRAAVSD